MFGLGPIPWPFVRRSRFVRELTKQGEAYRQNVWSAEQLAKHAQQQLRNERALFVDTVSRLNGWSEDACRVVVDAPDAQPQHFQMKVVRDLRGMRHTFVYDVSDAMLSRLKGMPPANAGQLLQAVSHSFAAQTIAAVLEGRET